jgi:ankyrin repeat protein
MHFNQNLFHLFLFITAISWIQAGDTTQDRSSLMATPKDTVMNSLANDIHETATNDYIGIESPHLSHSLIKDELIEAARRGSQIQIITDTESALNLKKYFGRAPSNMTIIPLDTVSAKRALINNGSQTIVWFGSMNMSDDAGEHHDITLRSTDPNFYALNLASQQQLDKSAKSQNNINFTSQQIIRSSTKEAQEAKKKAIHEFQTCATKPDDYLYFVAYNLDDPEIEKEILDAQKKAKGLVTIILDNKTWKNHRLRSDFLKPLISNNANVYIFNKDQTKKTASGNIKTMHIKSILRKCGETSLLLISSGNFTPQGKQNINYDLWQPISSDLANQFKSTLDAIAKESEKLTLQAFVSGQTIQDKTQQLLDFMQYSSRMQDRKDDIINLIRDGADVNTRDDSGNTLLIKAVLNNQDEIVKELLDADAKVNDTGKNKITPLEIATSHGFWKIAELLIMADADINQADANGTTPLAAAIAADNTDIAKLLIEHTADINKGTTPPIIQAVMKRNADMVQLLINANATVDARDSDGFTALLRACESRNTAMIALLANAKANLNILNPKTGNTAFLDAFLVNDLDVISALINAGANMGTSNTSGKTILDLVKDKKDLDPTMRNLFMQTQFFKSHPEALNPKTK